MVEHFILTILVCKKLQLFLRYQYNALFIAGQTEYSPVYLVWIDFDNRPIKILKEFTCFLNHQKSGDDFTGIKNMSLLTLEQGYW